MAGTSLVTQQLGFSDTVSISSQKVHHTFNLFQLNLFTKKLIYLMLQLGAFLAGALLAETNFRTQIEADIRPFRGLLLGLFFVTTGTSIDMQVLAHGNIISFPAYTL